MKHFTHENSQFSQKPYHVYTTISPTLLMNKLRLVQCHTTSKGQSQAGRGVHVCINGSSATHGFWSSTAHQSGILPNEEASGMSTPTLPQLGSEQVRVHMRTADKPGVTR